MNNDNIFKAAGFVHDPNRDLWFNRADREAFSQEVISDHDSTWLKLKLQEHVPEDEFRFYRNTPDPETCVEILDQLGLGVLTPVESLS